jgi:hypothetical protein
MTLIEIIGLFMVGLAFVGVAASKLYPEES